MFISKIVRKEKGDIDADVYVSDGEFSVLCFMYSNYNSIGNVKSIISFGCSNILKSDILDYDIKKLNGYYAYYFVAQVVSKESNQVKVGEIFITLDDNIPGDIGNGDYISFQVLRLDIVCDSC